MVNVYGKLHPNRIIDSRNEQFCNVRTVKSAHFGNFTVRTKVQESTKVYKSRNSVVRVQYPISVNENEVWHAYVHDLFMHQSDPQAPEEAFAYVQWFQPHDDEGYKFCGHTGLFLSELQSFDVDDTQLDTNVVALRWIEPIPITIGRVHLNDEDSSVFLVMESQDAILSDSAVTDWWF